MMNVLVRPVITEKSIKDTEKSIFTFLVRRNATKEEIKNAVGKLFDVEVISVATTVIKGKTKRVGVKREEIVKTPMKKAFVALKKGQKISAFELGA